MTMSSASQPAELSGATNGADSTQQPLSSSKPNDTPTDDGAPTLIIIHGETTSGGKFRPSDWCDRLYGALRVLGDEAEEVADYVHLVNYKGKKCILIDTRLEDCHDKVYRFFICFAEDNKLSKEAISQQHWDSTKHN